ncbi:MAG: SDR family NAD(P)-dependent oxidoreductase [Bacillota bacterium]|nr:SDR family NAD(P)-dependent oxidoreductase [Bacillota bacterium]
MNAAAAAEAADRRGRAARLAPALRVLLGSGARRPLLRFVAEGEAVGSETLPVLTLEENVDFDALRARIADLGGPAELRIPGLGSFLPRQAAVTAPGRRLAGRIVLVTGAAQGFGEGIARELAAEGAVLVIADLNLELAECVAAVLRAEYGPDAAIALPVDVSDESSVAALMETVALRLGGLDLLVSNAGVLRAGGLEDMTLASFEFVTRVNYTGFYLVTRYGARLMRAAAAVDPEYSADIVQVNSKSGLEGSNRNFAYAGGKFGGIGLVQSFAKELVDDRIKVNAVCPGNYYEGPLWSDPEKGLFVQYLNSGKVPGATNVEDVYRHYVKQVPMRRGCSPLDVSRAILYCVEQAYETGQALPVTGGQTMLN